VVEQKNWLMLHRARHLFIRPAGAQRTMNKTKTALAIRPTCSSLIPIILEVLGDQAKHRLVAPVHNIKRDGERGESPSRRSGFGPEGGYRSVFCYRSVSDCH